MTTIKFIADVNVEKAIVDYLADVGYDIKWILIIIARCLMRIC